MKILKLFPLKDHPFRYNYHINYGVWDKIEGDSATMQTFDANLDDYDAVFLPMFSRWSGHTDLLDRIKNHKIRKILFDNDSCYRSFSDGFYNGMDYIFYRCLDRNGDRPRCDSSHLLWSVDHERMTPVYGGQGVSFSCSLAGYSFRREIAERIRHKRIIGADYIESLQQSAAAIHTVNSVSGVTRAKVVEFAACGTQIISTRTPDMGLYFPDELITYFDTIDELVDIVESFRADIITQKCLREIVKNKHTDKIRAKQILNEL
jgi:hypothetical protein